MNKGKDGSKEAKKPRQAPVPSSKLPEPATVGGQTAGALAVASLRKKKW